jgi:mannitol/fructose-specific phosphotransferase system IIA component (Ntr-type)
MSIVILPTKSIDPPPAPGGLAGVFSPEAVLFGLEGSTGHEIIAKLVRHAVTLGRIPAWAEDDVAGLVERRERLGSTALGKGIAFPHCRSPHTQVFAGVAGFAPTGIPFRVVDAEPVDMFFLILAPPDLPKEFLDVLGRMVAIGRDRTLMLLLRGCQTAEHVSSVLREFDQSSLDDDKAPGSHRVDIQPADGKAASPGDDPSPRRAVSHVPPGRCASGLVEPLGGATRRHRPWIPRPRRRGKP